MEQYPIPQFIEAEAKIAFFISFRQFFYLVGAGVICFVLYFILPKFLFFIALIIVFGAAIILAFVTINGAPAVNVLLNSLGFMAGAKNYTWKKKESEYPFKAIKRIQLKKIEEKPVLNAQESRLKKIHTQIEMKSK
jgi:hypothetical protein